MSREFNLEKLVRENIKSLTPYSSARLEESLKGALYLDANENPYNSGYNRYPQPINYKLKELAANLYGQKLLPANIFAGNGSDEAIDLIIRIFCTPGVDNIISISPTYGLYRVAASINGVEYRDTPLGEGYTLCSSTVLQLCDSQSRVIFLCSPNNPTGNLLERGEVLKIVEKFNGIVVVDEAYIEFAKEESLVEELFNFPNLIILRTLSKAKGMAAIRMGFAIASTEIVEYMERIKYPYNLNSTTQELAIKSLSDKDNSTVAKIVAERERLTSSLEKLEEVVTVFPSDTNFLLVEFKSAKKTAQMLKECGIIVRDRSDTPGCREMLRISVGKSSENSQLLSALRGEEVVVHSMGLNFSRITKESAVNLTLYRGAAELSEIETGIGFLNHMFTLLAHHWGVGIDLFVKGDLDVDEHHTIEDSAIVLGEAIEKLYRGAKNYRRYAFVLPMDESRAEVVIDLGGRFAFGWEVNFSTTYVGDFPTQMFKHFFYSLALSGHFALHMSAKGENDHHIAESLFKAFGRALRDAMAGSGKDYEIPSSKGLI